MISRLSRLLLMALLGALAAGCGAVLIGDNDAGARGERGGSAAGAGGAAGSPDGTTGGTGDPSATGSGGAGVMIPTSCAEAATVLQTWCWTCHLSPPQPIYANLDLQSPNVAQRLVGVLAYTGVAGLCGGQGNLLDPGALPATGILIDKINFRQGCGAGMPSDATQISAAEIDCLQAWANGLVAGVAGN